MDRFRIDWRNLPKISTRPRGNNDWRKLIRVRRGPKNHSVNPEKSYTDRAKAARLKQLIADRSAEHKAFKDAMAAYWRGERDSHP